VETDQVGAQQAIDELPLPGTDSECLPDLATGYAKDGHTASGRFSLIMRGTRAK